MNARGIVFTGPREASLAKMEIAEAPLTAHEVLLRTHYSLISPGTELANYAAEQTLFPGPRTYPISPGYAAVGEVIDAGAEAPARRGDTVLAHTPHQAITRFDSSRHVCVRVPDGIEPEQATLARLAQVSAVSIRLMGARPGDQAAVIGLGLVGNLAAQLLRCAGLRVLGVEPMAERRRQAERCGIPVTLDPAAGMDGREATCSVVLECSGQDSGVRGALDLAALHGEVFLIGAAWKRGTAVVAADVTRPIFNKYLALRSGWEWQIPLYGSRPPGSIAGCTAWILACMRDKSLILEELISDRVSPEQVPAAYADLLDHPAAHLG
ncbi:MAG: zinc-dependent alcohol dehydrogenase, partial [Chloroflexota bacterium]